MLLTDDKLKRMILAARGPMEKAYVISAGARGIQRAATRGN
jgi:hypothetical protein